MWQVDFSALKKPGEYKIAVDGEVNRRFLLRAVGPGLAAPPFNIPGALSNPRLTLFRGSEILSANDNWSDTANADEIARIATAVGAFPLAAGSADAALLIDLAPGAYTIHAAGVDGATGVAVVEVYEVQ